MASKDPTTTRAAALRVPLHLERIPKQRLWGGRALERVLGIVLDVEGPIGESWELVDRNDENSRVCGGPFEGLALRDLLATDREALLGAARPTAEGRFPVIIKYLSASKPLSVQVHPDDRTARQLHAGESGKTESWFILEAAPGSLVYLGLQPDVDPASLGAIAGGPGIVDLLQPWPVRAGQFVHVPAGTLHAIGEGITLVEVQQNSDVTYRLYDWGRVGLDGKPRATHVDQALLAIRYGEPVSGPVDPVFEALGGDNRRAQLLDGEHYGLDVYEVGSILDLDTGGRAQALVLLEGSARILLPDSDAGWEMQQGDTWLLPAAVGAFRFESAAAKVIAVDTKA